jgi:AcrR family transcriptional regulator
MRSSAVRKPSSKPDATIAGRGKLLRAAETIIVESGVQGVTARSLTRRAGVNLGMVSYHFDGMDGLMLRVFNENFEKFISAQTRLWDELGEQRRGPDLNAILGAVVRSLWQPPVHIDHGRGSQIIDDLYSHGSLTVRRAAVKRLEAGLVALMDQLAPLVPHLSRDALMLRLTCIAGAVRSLVPRSSSWELYCKLAATAARSDPDVIREVTAFAVASLLR